MEREKREKANLHETVLETIEELTNLVIKRQNNEYNINYRKINAFPEKKANHSEYKRNYRKANAFPEKTE